MKKLISLLLVLVLGASFAVGCASGSAKSFTIAVPNDPTNEARALRLLEANGLIKLKEGSGETATKLDIAENPYNITIEEIEAAQLPSMLKDVDFAVINTNYAAGAGLNLTTDTVIRESTDVALPNVLAVKEGNENDPKLLALIAALQSQQVADKISSDAKLGAVSVVTNPTDGYNPSIDYAALDGAVITVAASPTPHAEILKVAAEILAAKGIALNVIEYTDYVQPNLVVDSGEIDANYFQHVPYMNDFNANNGTHLVSLGEIHSEPMGMYCGKLSSLDDLKK